MVSSAIANHGRAEDRQVLLHLPVGLSSRQTAHRRLSGAHNDRSQSHRQWLAVTAPAGRAYAVERGRPTCRREPRCCQTKQVPKKGVEGRRREARRSFFSSVVIKKALAHPSLQPLSPALPPPRSARARPRAPAAARRAAPRVSARCVSGAVSPRRETDLRAHQYSFLVKQQFTPPRATRITETCEASLRPISCTPGYRPPVSG